jgi:primase-like protein
MRGLEAELYSTHVGPRPQMREGDGRNNWLFRQLGREAHSCDDFDQLLDRAQTLNEGLGDPMQDAEVAKIAGSIWKYTTEGRNRFGKHGAWFPVSEVSTWKMGPDAFYLLAFLRAHNHPDATFWVANGLAEIFGWDRERFAAARRRLVEHRYHTRVSGSPASTRTVQMGQNPDCGKARTYPQLTLVSRCLGALRGLDLKSRSQNEVEKNSRDFRATR